MEGRSGATFGASEDGLAAMRQPEIDLLFLGIEVHAFDPPGMGESQEAGEESDVAHGRDLMAGGGDRSRDHVAALSGGTEKRGRGWGGWGAGPGGPAGPAPQGPRGGKTRRNPPSIAHEWLSLLDFYPHETRKNLIFKEAAGPANQKRFEIRELTETAAATLEQPDGVVPDVVFPVAHHVFKKFRGAPASYLEICPDT
jgi:hypothetical protein